ncbi:MAG: hypothetical protein V3V01_16525 [Acidimicrobiales bacterium]
MTSARRRRQIVASLGVLLVLLALSVPVALSLLAQNSSAEFAASENVGVNQLGAATLDIRVGASSTSFEATNMAPGDSAIGSLVLSNAGSLPLRYALSASNSGGLLADWMLFDVWTSDDCNDPNPLSRDTIITGLALDPTSTAKLIGDPTTGVQPGDRPLAPLETETVCLAARLPLAAPNEVQGTSITIDLVVDAEHDIAAS